MEISLSKGKA